MEEGSIKEVVKVLDEADQILRHRIRLNSSLGEMHACEEARELVQKAITKLVQYEK